MIVNCDRSDEATFPSLRQGILDIGENPTVHPIRWLVYPKHVTVAAKTPFGLAAQLSGCCPQENRPTPAKAKPLAPCRLPGQTNFDRPISQCQWVTLAGLIAYDLIRKSKYQTVKTNHSVRFILRRRKDDGNKRSN